MSSSTAKLQKDELVEEVQRFSEGLIRGAHLNLEVQCLEEDSVVKVELQGDDTGPVLANNARLLYAINHLLNRVFYWKTSAPHTIVVDCDDYRSARGQELRLLAQKAAATARSSGAAFSLQPMPAGERRVVHLTLAEELGVRTESEGTGLRRHVVIFPLP